MRLNSLSSRDCSKLLIFNENSVWKERQSTRVNAYRRGLIILWSLVQVQHGLPKDQKATSISLSQRRRMAKRGETL